MDIRRVVSSLCKSLCLNNKHSCVEWIYEIDDDVPPEVIGDPLRIKQILTNLVIIPYIYI
jgi:signal transduction histidine kinase